MTKAQKYGLLISLYLAQGLPYGFLTQALPVLLRDYGVSLKAIGLSSLLFLPWALKFLWAPLIDQRYWPAFGRRRSWIIPLQISCALTLIAVSFINPAQQIPLLLVGILLINFLSASQDVATDGLAVELLSEQERGAGNGIQVAGYRAGMIIGGGFLLIIFDRLGWNLSFLLMAVLLLTALLPIALYREHSPQQLPGLADSHGKMTHSRSVLLSFIRSPGVVAWLGMLVLYKLGDGLSSGMVKPMLFDQGFTKAEIGAVVGTFGFAAGLIGAVVGGWLTPRLGIYRALLLFVLLQGFAAASYAYLAWQPAGIATVTTIIVVEHFISSMHTVAMFVAMMSACRLATEGSDYSLQACVFLAASGFGIAASGFVADGFGYTVVHASGGFAALLAAVPILLVARRGGFRALRPAGNATEPAALVR